MLKKPKDENYCANVVKINSLIPLENCDNVQHAKIQGNYVIVGIDVKIGDIGLYYPAETQLSTGFLSHNNLFRDSENNVDKTKNGYFEKSRRIKTMKFRDNKSMGFFIPLSSLEFTKHNENLKVENIFDEINGIKICEKYVIKQSRLPGQGNKIKGKVKSIVDPTQFNFHYSTGHLGKSVYRIKPDDVVGISSKIHGSSLVSSNIFCYRKLSLFEKILKKIGVKIETREYKNIYSSRKVIKNDKLSNEKYFYKQDIWDKANKRIKKFLDKGMTVYAEIAGFLSNGSPIQKGYDYGCEPLEFKVFIYRITQTNVDGVVYEYNFRKVQKWCKENGLMAVPELFYGKVKELVSDLRVKQGKNEDPRYDYSELIDLLAEEYLEKDCKICNNKVPDEGIVIRNGNECYKFKSFRFNERETKLLDNGNVDIEDAN